MDKNNISRLKGIWDMMVPMLIIFAVVNAVEIFYAEILLVWKMSTYTTGSYIDFIEDIFQESISYEANGNISCIYCIICIYIFGKMFLTNEASGRGLKGCFKNVTSSMPCLIGGILIVTAGAQCVTEYLSTSFSAVFPQWLEEYNAILEQTGMKEESLTVSLVIYAVFLGPICEELAFRGLMLKGARSFMSPVAAIVAQAILFAGFHMNPLQSMYTLPVGILLGYVMYKYDNILVVIIMHMCFNSVAGFATEFIPTVGTSPYAYFGGILVSLLLCYAGVILLKRGVPTTASTDSDIFL